MSPDDLSAIANALEPPAGLKMDLSITESHSQQKDSAGLGNNLSYDSIGSHVVEDWDMEGSHDSVSDGSGISHDQDSRTRPRGKRKEAQRNALRQLVQTRTPQAKQPLPKRPRLARRSEFLQSAEEDEADSGSHQSQRPPPRARRGRRLAELESDGSGDDDSAGSGTPEVGVALNNGAQEVGVALDSDLESGSSSDDEHKLVICQDLSDEPIVY